MWMLIHRSTVFFYMPRQALEREVCNIGWMLIHISNVILYMLSQHWSV